jgi:hypothetical protein
MCAYNFGYPACKAHAPRYTYCHVWLSGYLYHIFTYYLINGTSFGSKLLSKKRVFRFSLQLLSETFLILSRSERDIIINVHGPSCEVLVISSTRHSCQILKQIKFYWHSLKNTWISSFTAIRPVGPELFHAGGRTNRQTWQSLYSLFAILRMYLNIT